MRFFPRGLPLVLVVFSLAVASPAQAQVVINEIMQNPNAVLDSAGEWFELHNAGGVAVDIDGWTIDDAGTDNHVINNGGPLLIPAGGYLVLGNNSDSGTNGGVAVDYNYGGSWFLANGDDEVILLDGAMAEMDRVEYDGGPNFPDPTGASMALIDPALDNNVGSNWCTSSTLFGAGDLGTPGAANDCATGPSDPLINEFVANHTGTDTNEYVEIFGDADTDYAAFTVLEVEGDSGGTGLIDEVIAVGTTDANGFWDTGFLNNAIENGSVTLILVEDFSGMGGDDLDADDDGNVDATPWNRIVDCIAVDDGGASDLTYCSAVLDLTLPPAGFTPGGASRIPDGNDTDTAGDWARNDFDGAGIPALDPGTPEEGEAFNTPGATNELVPADVPEIVVNEIMQNPAAVADGSGEWFELYNASPDPVDINGWTIADAGADVHVINNGGPLVIPAGGFLVLGNNSDSGTNGGVAVDYNYGGSWFLANGDDEVILSDPAMNEVDRVEYDGGPAFPDPTGASMALIDPALDNNDGANWCESSTAFGAGDFGTPGAVNDCKGSPIQLLINEVDADTPGTDVAEFVEIFDGGSGNTPLDGLVLVFFNGSDDASYGAFDLDGQATDADGYFVLCGDAANTANCDLDVTPDSNLIQNGADAVALYTGDAASFPDDTPVTTANLIDALVYDTSDADDAGLLVLLNAGQPQIDENGGGASATESNQRCPNGTGGPRNTDAYEQWAPTPGAENVCQTVMGPPMCGDTDNATLISAVQGTTDVSPLEGMVVEIEGIVVADLQGMNEYGGLFVQEEDADADGDPLTSEGIFVFTSEPATVGDHVRVRGTVDEFFNLTEISPATDVVICAAGVPLPTPAMPTLPMSALDEFEAIESMSIVMPQALIINDVFTAFRFGELTVSSTRRVQPTVAAAPGAPANAVAAANALDMLIVDDRRTPQNLAPPINGQDDINPIAADNPIRNGQVVTGLAGVMHYAFDAWRVQPTAPFVINESGNLRTAAPSPVGGTLRVASFNVLNFFTTIDTGAPICGPLMNQECRGADSMDEYTRQLDKLVAALSAIDADVVGLMELENNANASLQALTDAVNAALGAGTYDYIDTGTIGGDVIKVGFIYKPASVTPEGGFALLTSAVDPRFNDALNRPSLAQSFRANSNLALFTPIVNHLKSKGCGGATGADEDQGDGQGCFNATRTSAAEALRDWAIGDPTGAGSDNVLIIGDLNSYAMEDPIQALEAGGLTDLEPAFGGPDAYSYVFFGQIGSLDHAMSTATLTPQVTGTVPWNINADEIPALDYNTEFDVLPSFYAPTAYRSSDHDPIVIGLQLDAALARATFRVIKDFDDNNPADVEVRLSCNTGLPLEQQATIAEGEHVEFVVGDFTLGTLDCSVSETVPGGYTPMHTAGLGVNGIAAEVMSGENACSFGGVSNGQFTCAISNTLQAVEITVFKEWIDENPQFELPQFVEIELSCSEAGFVGAQFIAPGDPGVFSVFPHFDGETCTVSEQAEVGVITDTGDCDGLLIEPGQDAECTVVNTRLYAGIPTLSQNGLAILALLMLAMGFVAVRRLG